MKRGSGDLDTFADGAPDALFARMRGEAPVMWTDAPADWPAIDQPGFWSVTRAEHVAQVSKDPKTYSSWLGGWTMRADEVGSLDVQRSVMIGKDGDEHVRMRGTVNTAFTGNETVAQVVERVGVLREDDDRLSGHPGLVDVSEQSFQFCVLRRHRLQPIDKPVELVELAFG